ncbi:hypothetical protein [Magnetospirillum aberrantis]|uniref:Uncharacterized protein n=1 Tax=Magnetospirillum aberrantis SpK TaxID=908842 RepID=A0A7C9QUD3_9PROT|nr:hypothetical protein [Magnetospirillum aberrantis]NFV80299.1 hypothetical protein [Magnetospirillum aberrantis SpK]
MRTKPMFRRLMAALPHEGERRFQADGVSLQITRHDTPFTIISVLVKDNGHNAWVTVESDAGDITLHHPRNVDLVDKALDKFL